LLIHVCYYFFPFKIHYLIFFFLFTESYSGTPSTLYITVYGRVFTTDGVSSYVTGTMTAQVSSSMPTVSKTYTIYAIPSVIPGAIVSQFFLFVFLFKNKFYILLNKVWFITNIFYCTTSNSNWYLSSSNNVSNNVCSIWFFCSRCF